MFRNTFVYTIFLVHMVFFNTVLFFILRYAELPTAWWWLILIPVFDYIFLFWFAGEVYTMSKFDVLASNLPDFTTRIEISTVDEKWLIQIDGLTKYTGDIDEGFVNIDQDTYSTDEEKLIYALVNSAYGDL